MSGGLRIHFDTAFDSGAWVGARAATFGEAWFGELGLLGRLELELGLTGPELGEGEGRAALASALEGQGGWWRRSFDVDPLATSARLLADRDALALWGWRGQSAGPRLDALWAATRDALPGVPDRLHRVIEALTPGRLDIESVRLCMPMADLPTTWKALFGRLRDIGIEFSEAAAAVGPGPRERILFRPHGALAAADEVAASLAALEARNDVVVIGGDAILDGALTRHGLPRLGSPAEPASAALVRLVVEAAFDPMDPGDLHALLCLDPGPVPRRVARRLVYALARFPGRGSRAWREALDQGLLRCDPEWRAEVAERLAVLLEPSTKRDGRLGAADVSRRLRALATWARGRAPTVPTLLGVARMAASLRGLVERRGGDLSYRELRFLCDDVDGSVAKVADAGLAAVAEPGGVLAPANIVVWWNFTRAHAPLPRRLRLSDAERKALAAAGVVPPEASTLVEAEARRWRRPLCHARDLLLLVCPRLDEMGEPAHPHPLWDELGQPAASPARSLVLPAVPRRVRPSPRPLPKPMTEVATGIPLTVREHESASSIERLLGCSLAWALHIRGRLLPGFSAGPASPSPILFGMLAHHILAQVFSNGALPPDEAAASAAVRADAQLAGHAESLALPRHQADRVALRRAIVDSARELGRLMTETGASVRGVELGGKIEREGTGYDGYADLVLSQPDVVIDLKWGRTTYRDKLRQGTALQLALYAELFATERGAPAVAYFILKTQELLGEPGSALPGAKTPGRFAMAEIWSGAHRALVARKAELAVGNLFAPAADGTHVKSAHDGATLLLGPSCDHCQFDVLCGRSRCR